MSKSKKNKSSDTTLSLTGFKPKYSLQTKKKKSKKGLSKSKKKELWNTFDDEITKCEKDEDIDCGTKTLGDDAENDDKKDKDDKHDKKDKNYKIECVYRSSGERETV